MEITPKGIAALVIPTLVTIGAGFIDNALKWRAEIQQREYERQIKLLDKIVNTADPDQRIVIATFYLNSGTFTGLYKDELEASLIWAKAEIQRRNDTTAKPPATLLQAPGTLPPVTAVPQPEAVVATAVEEGVADLFSQPSEEVITIEIPVVVPDAVQVEAPKNIFTFDIK